MGIVGPASCTGVPVVLRPPLSLVVCLGGYGEGPVVVLSAFLPLGAPAGACPGLSL